MGALTCIWGGHSPPLDVGGHSPPMYLLFGALYWLTQLRVFLHLTHWGRVTHICVVDLTIIGSDNGLSPGRRQAIIWTNAGILLIEPLGTNFSEILIEIHTFSFKKMHLKMASAKWRPFCLGLNELTLFLFSHADIRQCPVVSKRTTEGQHHTWMTEHWASEQKIYQSLSWVYFRKHTINSLI